MIITLISTLHNCNNYIDNYLKCLSELNDLQNNKLIIWNIIESNSKDTNLKLEKFAEGKENITLLKKTKKEDTGLYNSWNEMLELVDTELVCNYNPDDKLHPNFLIDYSNEFEKNKNLNLLCCQIKVSKEINDNFENNLPLMYDKKKIFYDAKDDVKDIEPDYMNYEYKLNLLKKCYENNKYLTKTKWVHYNNVSLFDFFRIDGNNFIDINNYNLFSFPNLAPVWKTSLYKKYGKFNEKEYSSAADIELWLRFFINEGNFKVLNKPYIIYYNSPQSYGHAKEKKNSVRKIIKKYHPLFNLFDNKIDVIIPYRDRELELKLFIENFKNTFDIYFDYKINVIEQNNNRDFSRSKLMNFGIKKCDYNKLLLIDVDLIFKKIPISLLYNNQKIYGVYHNKLSVGGGAILINNNNNFNGYSNFYEGWGSEDTDFGYRLFFNNSKLSYSNLVWRDKNDSSIIEELKLHEKKESNKCKKTKLNFCIKNNEVLIQQIINYNLIFYYENKDKFINKETFIFYNDKKFFEGVFDNNYLIKGKLYDLRADTSKSIFVKDDNVLIYEGEFINGLPGGLGEGYNLWGNKCFSGLILNGYLFNKNKSTDITTLDKYVKLDVLNRRDFKLYKTLVYNGLNEIIFSNETREVIKDNIYKYKFNTKLNVSNKLHFSKKLMCCFEFIHDNYEINKILKLINTNNIEIKKEKQGIYNLYYNDSEWQYPVITEKRVFELFFENKNIPNNYFAFPWATLWDKIVGVNIDTKLLSLAYSFEIKEKECFTVCQQIAFRRFLPLFKKIGITHVFACHCSKTDFILEEKYNIKIIPFPLYPYNENNDKNLVRKNNLLCSFKGSNNKCYLTDIRKKIKYLDKYDDCYIKVKDKWHFHDIVYEKQILNKKLDQKILDKDKENEGIFKDFLIRSKFSLCPGGSGPNTIRLWESLSFGSIPIILSNDLKLPDFVDWDDICIVYDEQKVEDLYEYLKKIPDEVVKYKSNKCIEIYKQYFSKKNFTKTIFNIFLNNYESKKIKDITINNLNDILKTNNINQINISNGVYKDIKLPKLSNDYDINAPILFFGMYNMIEFYKFKSHKGKKYVIWCNNDCNYNNKTRRILINKIKNNITHSYYYADNCKKNLDLFEISCDKIML